jgi:hypothetical protein
MKDLKTLIAMTEKHKNMHVLEKGEDGFAFGWQVSHHRKILVMVGIGGGWDHVSVSHRDKTPTYQEMKKVKRWCFKPTEWVVEYHPPSSDYISINDNVLHMWLPQEELLPTPPMEMV